MFEPKHSTADAWLTSRQRFSLGLAVFLYELALVIFAALPLTTVILPEAVVIGGSATILVGILTHVSDIVSLPGDEWCYALAVVLNAYTLLAYLFTIEAGHTIETTVSFTAFLVAGIVLPFAAHLLDGGRRNGRA